MASSNIGKRRLANIRKRFDIPFKCTEEDFTYNNHPWCHRCVYDIDCTTDVFKPKYFYILFYKNRTYIGGTTKSHKWIDMTVTSKTFYKVYQFIDFILREYEKL